MTRALAIALCLAAPALGCYTSRSTTTARTAVEQALLSQSAESTLAGLEIPAALQGKSYFLVEDQFEATDGKWVVAQVHQKLLAAGLKAGGKKTADVFVYPSVANAAIDDSRWFLGLPALPIPIPNVGAVTLPELALFKYDTQRGRNRMNVYGHHGSGELAFQTATGSTEKYFTRWTILLFIAFRTTDLAAPF
jgi:hypothetical protein